MDGVIYCGQSKFDTRARFAKGLVFKCHKYFTYKLGWLVQLGFMNLFVLT